VASGRSGKSAATTSKTTVPRKVEPSANKSAGSATRTQSAGPLPKGAPGGIDRVARGANGTTKAPGQGPGPSLVGMDNEVGSAVPSRILTTRVVRRASHGDATLRPGKLVDYGRSFGK
jgi:hypothetical protein